MTKIYTGIDIVDNKRIQNAISKFGDTFLKRIFTEKEINYCTNQKNSIQCFSARFACKEAFIKAFYSAFQKKLSFKEIEIIGKQGEPAEILLHPIIEKNNILIDTINISFSIAHEKNNSVAIVIIYI